MPSNVTQGNTLVVVVNKTGGASCSSTDTFGTFTDTLGSAFYSINVQINVNGFQSTNCISKANLLASGADTITKPSTGEPGIMWVLEVTGVGFMTAEVTAGQPFDSVTTFAVPNMTTARPTALLICAGSNNNTAVFTAATPAGATKSFVGPVAADTTGAMVYQFVGPGTYSCGFTLSGTGTRVCSAGNLLVYTENNAPLVGHTMASGNAGATTPAINTTGATLVVMNVAANTGYTVSDSKGNTWNTLTPVGNATFGFSTLWYCSPCTVGTGHTFTFSGASLLGSIFVAAFSGSGAVGTQATGGVGGIGATTCTTGSVTPTQTNQLVVSGYQKDINFAPLFVNNSFIITDEFRFNSGANYGGGLAYRLTSAATPITWTGNATQGRDGCSLASFLNAVAGVPRHRSVVMQ